MSDDREQAIEAALDEMVAMQRERVLNLARRQYPRITLDDLMQPHDYPGLAGSPEFEYEDGYLAGLIAAQIGLRARVFRKH